MNNLFSQERTIKSPKEFEILQISPFLACDLNAEWHSRLPKIHPSNIFRNRYYICFGAYIEHDVYATAIWSSPVNQSFDIETTLELRRMAISDDCPKNTASYMIAKMIKDIKKELPLVKRLISYQDKEVHLGTIYKASNWTAVYETKYRAWNKTRQRNNEQSKADKVRWEYAI